MPSMCALEPISWQAYEEASNRSGGWWHGFLKKSQAFVFLLWVLEGKGTTLSKKQESEEGEVKFSSSVEPPIVWMEPAEKTQTNNKQLGFSGNIRRTSVNQSARWVSQSSKDISSIFERIRLGIINKKYKSHDRNTTKRANVGTLSGVEAQL